jgi:phosphatidylglycerophosphatase A
MQEATLLPPDPLPARQPTVGFMLSHPAHLVALGFGSGLMRAAPGTWGTLAGWASFIVLQQFLTSAQLGELILLSLPLGWWACTVTARNLRSLDPGSIVWDEVVAFWIVLWVMTPAGWAAQLAAFLLFRLFDTWKPGPMGWADRTFKDVGWRGGFGIVVDDLVAAFCTLLVLALWKVWA